ncbi:hypothetical protein BV25DRAFT_1229471 [Artomyces pyxidatus]|uniref:Uncharacterized protein n=1 Tax=Artomyces pyxidatus TaxID=48021 RepID=A0ACB8SRH2_9AGAM|nr:hypothetical protein BV25DRAFT_1229471 [Artomyces pyxidatus]
MSTLISTTTSTASESTPSPLNSDVGADEEPLFSDKYYQSARYREWMKTALQRRRHRPQLTPDIDPAFTPSPLEYHFGLSIKEDKLLEYVISKDLLDDDDDFPVDVLTLQVHATEYLQNLTENPTLYTAAPFTEKNDDIVVALYSNYTIRDNKYIDDHERQILDIVRKELLLEGQAPMWYWDLGN